MAHLLKDLLLIAIYNIRHVFCNNSMPIKAYKILTREVTVLDSKNNRARGRLTRRCNIPEEGSFCILKYRANITQDLSFFISFPSKFLSLFAVPNLLSSGIDGEAFKLHRHLHGRKEIENQSGSSDNIWARRFNKDEKLWKKTQIYVRLSL